MGWASDLQSWAEGMNGIQGSGSCLRKGQEVIKRPGQLALHSSNDQAGESLWPLAQCSGVKDDESCIK